MTSGTTCNPEDIVGLPFPFSDLASQKRRPVLVLTQADFRGLFMELPITKRKDHKMHRRISINSKICHGQACIKGTRIPVHQIIRMMANGDKIEDLLKDYPTLKPEDIYACLNYAASLAEEQITPIEHTL